MIRQIASAVSIIGICLGAEIDSIGVFPDQCGLQSLLSSMILLECPEAEIARYCRQAPYLLKGSNDLSLKDLKITAEMFNLKADGFIYDSVESLSDSIINEDGVYLVHLQSRDKVKGHFVACAKSSSVSTSQKILMVDYPNVANVVSLQDALSNDLDLRDYQYSRAALRIRKGDHSKNEKLSNLPVRAQESGVDVKDSDGSIVEAADINIKDSGEDILTGLFTINNASKETITIENVASSCGCFKGATFEQRVEPGHAESIKLEYMGSSFRKLKSNSLIIEIATKGGIRKLIKVDSRLSNYSSFAVSRSFSADGNFIDLKLTSNTDSPIASIVVSERVDGLDVLQISPSIFRVTQRNGLFFGKKIKFLIDGNRDFSCEITGMAPQ